MLYNLGLFLSQFWGPARLLTSYAVLICIGMYLGFFASLFIIPKFYDKVQEKALGQDVLKSLMKYRMCSQMFGKLTKTIFMTMKQVFLKRN